MRRRPARGADGLRRCRPRGGTKQAAGNVGEVPTNRLRRRRISGVTLLVAAVLLVLGLYVAFQRVAPLLRGSNCAAAGGGQEITLGTGQAGIAATIAGVAQRDALPARAV